MAITAFGVVLIILACLVPIAAFVAALIFMCHYGTREDRCLAWFPRVVLIIGLALLFLTIVLLPVDRANSRLKGGIDTGLKIFWQVIYGVIALYVVVIIPFAIFYYESEDPDKGIGHQICWGLVYSVIVLVVVGAIFGITYYWLGMSRVAYQRHISYTPETNLLDPMEATYKFTTHETKYMEIRVSFVIYIVALLSVAGWAVFVTCGGCGISALPIGCIAAFVFRERLMSGEEFIQIKAQLQTRSAKMIEMGEKLMEAQDMGKVGRKEVKLFQDYKKACYAIEEKWRITRTQLDQSALVVLKPIFQLICGIIFAVISIVLYVHVVLYMVVPNPVSPMLNTMLEWLDGLTSNFPAIGAIFYGLFAFYFLFAVLAGHANVVSKIPWCSIHPLIKGGTMMNSLMFVLGLLMLAGITTVQFVSDAFSSYARESAIIVMFDVLIKNLRGIYWIYYIALYVYIAMVAIGIPITIVFVFCFRQKTEAEENLEKILKELKIDSA